MTTQKIYEITAEEQDDIYLSGEWKNAGGLIQSLVFYSNFLNRLGSSPIGPELRNLAAGHEVGDEVRFVGCTIHDWGCGLGSGTALIQSMFPASTVVGWDYSEAMVEDARELWAPTQFRLGEITQANTIADIIFCSHTIEHVEDPREVIRRLRSLCKWLVVIVPPITEQVDGGHTGAAITEQWVDDIRPRHVWEDRYVTTRPTPDPRYPLMSEGNILLLYQGLQ